MSLYVTIQQFDGQFQFGKDKIYKMRRQRELSDVTRVGVRLPGVETALRPWLVTGGKAARHREET